jgi:RNA polymerase sigma-70 factor (ECF subfamily)
MYPTNTLEEAPSFGDVIAFGGACFGGAGGAMTAVSPVMRRRATRTEGGRVSAESRAKPGTGPMASLTSAAKAKPVAAEELFAANYPKLAGWVRRLVDDNETAHEIASEAFVRLLSRWGSLQKLENPQSYLYMIATNLVRDHWRKAERERRAMRTVTADAERDQTADPGPGSDIRALIQELPPRLRDPLLLHYYAGFGLREISVMLKRPEGTIKADLYHARSRLRAALASPGGAAEDQLGQVPPQRNRAARKSSGAADAG